MLTDVLKYVLIIALAPIWLPFVKALWEELNDALRPDGGLFGPEPTQRRREEILDEIAQEEMRVVHEPLAHIQSFRTEQASGGSQSGGPSRAAAPKTDTRQQRQGFRK
jgi:hypothetical protein